MPPVVGKVAIEPGYSCGHVGKALTHNKQGG